MMMTTLNHPALLIDLGHVGANGLPINSASWFQRELELCREWGFKLKKSSNNRISLEFDQEQLVPYWIQQETPAIAWDWVGVKGYLRVSSTNSEALEQARKGAAGGTLVYAEEQAAGRGRKDRIWFSPPGLGLYLSVILRPTQPIQFWPLLTHAASVALVETLKNLPDLQLNSKPLDLDLKWPNDVLISGKKCAGILLETTLLEGESHAAIVGLGINVHQGSVPASLNSTACCLDEMAGVVVPRRQLLVSFLRHFQIWYSTFEKGNHKEILDRWKSSSSMWHGVEIGVSDGSASRTATTCGLDEIGALIIRNADGKEETLLAGDVSLIRKERREDVF
jgi:BirA family transcriptional regulator, biotin operon repressor / biotin---[acetyl-CoA-carboxylase] ligase